MISMYSKCYSKNVIKKNNRKLKHFFCKRKIKKYRWKRKEVKGYKNRLKA